MEGKSFDNSTVALLSAAELPASIYFCAPAEQGPFSGTAISTTVSCGGIATTNAFASDVSTSTGNLWADVELGTSTYNPLVLNPGQSATITVAISPTNPKGTSRLRVPDPGNVQQQHLQLRRSRDLPVRVHRRLVARFAIEQPVPIVGAGCSCLS